MASCRLPSNGSESRTYWRVLERGLIAYNPHHLFVTTPLESAGYRCAYRTECAVYAPP